jgi:hypothetical protein
MLSFYYGGAAIVTVILWLLSELKTNSNKIVRISYGLGTIVLVLLTFQSYTSITPVYERMFTGNCIYTIKSIIQKGEGSRIIEALNSYQDESQKKSHYVALMNLRSKLHEIDKAVSNYGAVSDAAKDAAPHTP